MRSTSLSLASGYDGWVVPKSVWEEFLKKHGIVMIVCEQRVIIVYVSSGVNIDNHAICSCVYSVCQKTGHKNDSCKKSVERIHEVHKQIQNNQS